ncbi:MAG: YsnF/AvaK domain-containing protein [Chloroflexota bacterium]|nr:YsnF/AvaK domain-containing protein [Chloroflexota bacterium]
MLGPKDLKPNRPGGADGEPPASEQALDQPDASTEATHGYEWHAEDLGAGAERLAPREPLKAYGDTAADVERTLELREEQLVAHKELRELGEVEVRTELEEIPGRLEVDAYREEVEVEHEPVGKVVSEREEPWDENGVLVVPVYEEQLVVTKRLVLRERLRIRRVATTERQLFQDTLRRERLLVTDPQNTGLVHERYPTDEMADSGPAETEGEARTTEDRQEGGLLEHLVKKVLE